MWETFYKSKIFLSLFNGQIYSYGLGDTVGTC